MTDKVRPKHAYLPDVPTDELRLLRVVTAMVTRTDQVSDELREETTTLFIMVDLELARRGEE